jgi:hypothetical protein
MKFLINFLQYIICSFMHPLTFWGLLILGNYPHSFLFKYVSTNVYRYNLIYYIPIAMSLFSVIFFINFLIYGKSFSQISFKSFLKPFFHSQAPYLLFLLPQMVFAEGTEGNVFGFIIFMPSILWTFIGAFLSIKLHKRILYLENNKKKENL